LSEKRKFQPINNPLTSILKKYNLYESYEINTLFDKWSEIIGEKLAKISKPVNYDTDKNQLTIQTLTESWKMECLKHKENILQKLNQSFDSLKIKSIVFK